MSYSPTTTTPNPSRSQASPTTGPTTSWSLLRLMALATMVAILASACTIPGTGGDNLDSGAVVTPAPSGTVATTSDQGTMADATESPWTDASARAVHAEGLLSVFSAPDGDPIATLSSTTDFGTVRVLLVEEERDGWLKVRLPVRPNHQSGWIPSSSVEVDQLDLAVHIDLANRVLTVRDGEQTLLSSPVAIGTAENPTPTGTFSITDKLETSDPAGAYGPFALGLSGYSETITEFAGGNGQIGIHGTNDLDSIGREASHGCIRVPNSVVEQLAELLPLGTPVHVV